MLSSMANAVNNFALKNLNLFVVQRTREDGQPLGEIFDRLLSPTKTVQLVLAGDGSDGSYYLPDDFEGVGCVLSPGFGGMLEFERDMLQRGLKCYVCDGNVSPNYEINNLDFENMFLADFTSEKTMTMSDWLDKKYLNGKSDIILQMDIEGHEYSVINSLDDDFLKRCRTIIIEFHFLQMALKVPGYNILRTCVNKLLKNHQVVHVNTIKNASSYTIGNTNIPAFVEVTFHRNDNV